MKSKIIELIVACIVMMSWAEQAYSLQEDTHKAINEYIAQNIVNGYSLNNYLIGNLGFNGGAEEKISGYGDGQVVFQEIFKWLGYGGVQEDRPGRKWDYVTGTPTRSVNHFHNPLKPWGEAGLNDILSGQSSIRWAQNTNQNPGGMWSWYDARTYFYTALTAAAKTARDENFAKTFRAVGQQMHLVHDASVPEHVRNDAHALPGYEK